MAGIGINDLAAYVRKLNARLNASQDALIAAFAQLVQRMDQRVPSITEEIDAIPGRRMVYTVSSTVNFTIAALGTQGPPAVGTVSQDGPFIMTHYPMVTWKPTLPANTTNLGRWRPVSSFPLPDQVVDTDILDLSYQLQDAGTGRLMSSAPSGAIFSRPDNMVPLPVPTMFAAAAVVNFIPTYNAITWDSAIPPTEGQLQVDLIGYRIVNL